MHQGMTQLWWLSLYLPPLPSSPKRMVSSQCRYAMLYNAHLLSSVLHESPSIRRPWCCIVHEVGTDRQTELRLLEQAWNVVETSWNVIAHGDAQVGKWRGNWRMEWVASTLHTTSEHGVSSITTADAHTSVASSRLNWRPHRFKWNRPLVRFAERRNMVSARVPSHFKRSLPRLD